MGRRRASPILTAVLSCAALGCAAGPRPDAPPSDGEVAAEVRELEGYAAGFEPDPVFGGRVWVTVAGPADAPPVVLVHGSGTDASDSWHPILPALAREHRVVLVDLPGFGRSSGGNHLYTPFRYAKALRQVVERHTDGPISLVGHSMGGAVAVTYAALRASEISRLVVLDVVGVLHAEDYLRYTMPAGGMLVRAMRYPGPDRPYPREMLADADMRRRYLQGSPAVIAGLALLVDDLGPAIERITAPTLILRGEQDRIASPRASHALRARLPGARFEPIEQAGHVPMKDRPEVVAERLLEWIREPLPAPPGEIPSAAELEASGRVGRCRKEEKVHFEGVYARVELEGCGQVRIEDAAIGELYAYDSVVKLRDVDLRSAETPLRAIESLVEVTGGEIEGDVCVETRGSDVNVAGALLDCRSAAVRSTRRSTVVFSVTRLDGPNGTEHLHEMRSLAAGKSR